jgi:adenosyl cobinamide kinase/adenosyl cobinamide phosphate guanylyltransferase
MTEASAPAVGSTFDPSPPVSLVFLLGGARSGKSTLAVQLATESEAPVVFVATAEAFDDEMRERIAAHRGERPRGWQTVEAPRELADALRTIDREATVVVDCLSLWVANLLQSGAAVEEEARQVAGLAAARPGRTIAVSNEVGLGLVPTNALGRRYRDLLGRTNAIWAASAAQAFLIVAGRALPLHSATGLLDD